MKAIYPNYLSNDITELQSDDPVVFGRFVKKHQKLVFSLLGRMGFSQADAEYLAQDTFLRAWNNRKSYQPDRAKISTWLCTIARNVALNEIDKKSRRPVGSDEEPDTVITTDSTSSPEHQASLQQDIKQLNQTLHALSAEERSTIALHYAEELSTRDAALIMGCSTGAFRTRLTRARKKLQNIWNSTPDSGNSSS